MPFGFDLDGLHADPHPFELTHEDVRRCRNRLKLRLQDVLLHLLGHTFADPLVVEELDTESISQVMHAL